MLQLVSIPVHSQVTLVSVSLPFCQGALQPVASAVTSLSIIMLSLQGHHSADNKLPRYKTQCVQNVYYSAVTCLLSIHPSYKMTLAAQGTYTRLFERSAAGSVLDNSCTMCSWRRRACQHQRMGVQSVILSC